MDAGTHNFCFRTYDDNKNRKDRTLSKNFYGTFKQHKDALTKNNKMGASVCVIINLGGHSDPEIEKIRFVFADTDGAPARPLFEALRPHAIVQSSLKKFHIYWRITEFPLEKFTSVQKAIAMKYDTDNVICNPSQIMRLPGFFHQKNTPQIVHTKFLDPELPPYNLEQICDGLGLNLNLEKSKNEPLIRKDKPLQGDTPSASLQRVEQMLYFFEPFESYKQWVKVGLLLADDFGEEGRDLFLRWSRGDLWQVTKR